MSEPATPPRSDLTHAALDQLRRNDVGPFVKPAERQYPHQWNWDAALVALGLSRHDPERARREVRALLRGAWADGMVPHILYHLGASDYRPSPEFWRTAERHPSGLPTSGLSQPPILATCLRMMHDRAPAEERGSWLAFLNETYDDVLAWHRWWHRARDPESRGLVAILHPWESGTDDAPRFVGALARIVPRDVPAFERGDRTHVDPSERPDDADYARFVHLIDVYRRRGWDPDALWDDAPFKVLDPFVNAVLYRAHDDLGAIAERIGRPRAEQDAWRAAMRPTFEALWNDRSGTFEAWDAASERPLDGAGVAGFAALWARLASPARAARLRDAFDDPAAYAPDADGGVRLPSSPKHDYFFAPRRYWRGPMWIVANWMIADGFDAADMPDAASILRADALGCMRRHGFAEHYDPRDGTAGGATGFSWSAALALVLERDVGRG